MAQTVTLTPQAGEAICLGGNVVSKYLLIAGVIGNYVEVTYRQGAGDPFQVVGILQKESDEEQHQDGVYASMFALLADLPSRPDHGDEFAVDGVNYTVYEVFADLTGAARLQLRQNS